MILLLVLYDLPDDKLRLRVARILNEGIGGSAGCGVRTVQ